MLHQKLISNFKDTTLKKLYTEQVKISHPVILKYIQSAVRKIRTSNTAHDQLQIKLQVYGNNGNWGSLTIRSLRQKRYDLIFKDKNVSKDFLGKWRSIEFECIFKDVECYNKFVEFVVSNKLYDYVTAKHDGSIHGIGFPKEIILTYKKGDEDTVIKVCSMLNKLAYANNTCGTHVHFDMRHCTEEKALECANNFALCVPALKTILPLERRNNRFCSTVINKPDSRSRYSFVNTLAYKKYNTIEIRGHHGTINSKDILNWINLCETLMFTECHTKAVRPRSIRNIESLKKKFILNKEMHSYLDKNYKKFNTAAITT